MNRVPPYDLYAEQAVLGSLLLENSVADEITGILTADDFYNTGHQVIFKAIVKIIESGQVADILTVSSDIAADGKTEKTGGAAYVASLVDVVVSTVTAKSYAKIVRGKSAERHIIAEATRMIDAVYDTSETSKTKLEEAQKTILNLSINPDNATLQSSHEIAKKAYLEIEERNKRGGDMVIGHKTGLRDLDNILSGLNAGELIIIAGRPGMGKSALAVNIAVNIALENTPVVIFSLEMPSDSLMNRIFAGRTRIDSRNISRGMIFGDQWAGLVRTVDEISKTPLFIDDKPDITIQEIRAKCRKLKKENGLGLIVIDYIQLMKVTGKHDNREQQVAEISRTLKIIAREMECPVIGLSQLNRQVDSRTDRRPILSDLRESGAIEQDADVIAFIYRDEVYNKSEDNPERGIAEIDISKHRSGATGRIKTVFDAKTQTFRDLARELFADTQHRQVISEALANGEKIPDNVLSEYPGIGKEVEANNKRIAALEKQKVDEETLRVKKANDVKQNIEQKQKNDIEQRKVLAQQRLTTIPLAQLIKESGYKTNRAGVHDLIKEDQKKAIQRAISENKSVPPEVLKDYHDLVRQDHIPDTTKKVEASEPFAEKMQRAKTADEGRKIISDYEEEFASIEKSVGLPNSIGIGGSGFGSRGYNTLAPSEKKSIVKSVMAKNKEAGKRLNDLIKDIDAAEPHWNILKKMERQQFDMPVSTKKLAPEPDEIFIRAAEKKDLGRASKSLKEIPDKEGYEKVYKQKGSQGRGFYYVKAVEPKPPVKEVKKRPTKAKQIPAKGAQNLVTRILELGGLKVTGKDYNTRLLRQYPDAKRVLRMKSGLTADQLASRLQADGWKIESGDDLVELLKSGEGRAVYAPEIVDEKLNHQAERETNEWAEQQVRELEAAERQLAAEGIDVGAIEESKGDIIAAATETIGAERLTPEVLEANAREVDDFFDEIINSKQKEKPQWKIDLDRARSYMPNYPSLYEREISNLPTQILKDIYNNGHHVEAIKHHLAVRYNSLPDNIKAGFTEWVKQNEESSQPKETPKGEFKTGELEGFSEKENFSLTNPETEMSQYKSLSEQATPKNEDLFDNAKGKTYNILEKEGAYETKVSDTGSAGETVRDNTGGGTGVQYRPTVVGQEKVGSIEAKSSKITSSRDAAQVAHSYLRKFPDEHLLSLVIGKNGKLLHVYRHTIGLRGQSQASTSTIIGEALNTPGAESIIIAHNHPSQQAKLSPEDIYFYDQLKNLAQDSGLTVRDSLAVTDNGYTSYEETGGRGESLINAENGKAKIPLVGRVFEAIHNGEKITGPAAAIDAVKNHVPAGGTLLLDGANKVAGAINLSDYRKIRGETQKELLQEMEKRNARAMIVYSPDRAIESDEARNIQKFSNATGREIKLLDIIDSQGSKANDGYMPSENDSVFYARKDNNLAIVHNISKEKLLHAAKMGGLAVPSVAVIDIKKSKFDSYGEITLIASKENLGPGTGKGSNKYFNADVYSPRYPSITYRLDNKGLAKLNEILDPYRAENESKLYNHTYPTVDGITTNKAFIKYAEEKSGKGNLSYHELKPLAEDLLLKAGAQEKIFNGFTYGGNRKYLNHDLDTVVRLLKKELKDGEGFNYGAPSIRAKNAQQFRTVKQIQASRDSIISSEEMEKLKDEANDELVSLAEKTIPFLKHNLGFGNIDAFAEHIKEAIDTHNFNKVFGENSEYYEPGVDIKAIVDYVNKLRNMPTEYFEGKIQRAVKLNEFERAVIPDNASKEIIGLLEKQGLIVDTYKNGDSNSRQAAVKKAVEGDNLNFSIKNLNKAVPTRGISTVRIQSIIDKVTSTLNINPKINVVQHVSECPDAVLKDMERNGILDENGDADVQGFAWRGETWLVGDNLDSDVEAFKVLMHELTHNGLGALLNDNSSLKSVQWQYNNLMDKIISAHRREIMTIARTTHTHLNLNTIEGRRQAAEEWLCNQSYEAQHKWYDKLITIFNNLVRAMGLDIKLADAEVRTILREAFQTFEVRDNEVRYMTAWHGSPYSFERFSSKHIGTGEGAQTYGYGLYFAGKKEVAKWYKDTVKKRPPYAEVASTLKSHFPETHRNLEAYLKKKYKSESVRPEMLGSETIKIGEQGGSGLTTKDENVLRAFVKKIRQEGHLYEVNLAPNENEYLQWDMPLSKQSEKVKTALKKINRDYPHADPNVSDKYRQGNEFYYDLVYEMGRSPKAASDYLHSLGIRGIKYLDAGSRDQDGKLSYNYVIFNDKDVNIEARYARSGKALDEESRAFAAQLDDYVAGKSKPRTPITIGSTPYILERLGAKQLPLVITQNTLKKVMEDKHGLSLETLKQVPLHLADPIMVFDSATETDSLVVMTELRQEGKTIVAAIHLSIELGRNIVNNIASIHPRQSEHHFINWIENGLLRYMNKKKSRVWSVTSGLQLPTVRGSIQGSDKKILFDYDLVKRNPSDDSDSGVQYARQDQSADPVIKQRELGKKEEKRQAPAVHQSDFETLQAMPDLRVKPLGGWLENPIRTFEELGTKAKELFYRPVKEAEHKAKVEFKAIHEQAEKLRKSLSRKSSERIGIYALAQQKDGKEILKSMKITEVPKLDAKEMKAYQWMRGNLEEYYEKLQAAREAAGKEGFGKVENYFTFARQFSLAEKLGFSPIFTRSEFLNTVMHRKTTSFKYEKHRTGGMNRADLDAFGVFNRYMESATRHVALSPAIAKGREMLLTFKVPGQNGEDTNWLLRDEKPAAAKFLTEWLDFQAGQRKPQFPNLIEKGLGIINKNLAFAILSANIRSALIQPSAIVNTFAEIGPKWTFEGIKGMMDDSIIKKSNVLLSRQFDVNISESLAGMPGKFEAARQAIGNIGMKPLQFLDMITARATWQGAYKKALSEGMGEKAAINYADDVVTKTQGSAMPSDMAPVQRTAIGKSVTMFQTFVINQWGFLTKDVLGINNSQVSKKEAAKKIITFVAMAILFNMFYEDLLEVPAPLPSPVSAFVKSLDKGESMPSASADAAREIASIVPIIGGGLRYGSSPFGAPVEYVTDIFKKMLPNYSGPTRSAPELIGKGLGIPGTTQATKIARVEKKGGSLLDMALGRYDTDNDPRQIKKNMVRKLRNKDASAFADMRKYYQEGKLTKREIKAIRDEASVPEIAWKFKRLSLDEAIEEYKSASAEEKKLLRPVLKSKMHLLSELAPEPRKKKVMELKEALAS